MSKWVLGLDLGTTSIGYARLSSDDKPKILESGTHIFLSPREDKSGIPKNQQRRNARGQRRNLYRKQRRKKNLINTLYKIEWINFSYEDIQNYGYLFSIYGVDPFSNQSEIPLSKELFLEIHHFFEEMKKGKGEFSDNNSYLLRTKALDHPLTKKELAKVLFSLCSKRGFLSNSKEKKATDSKKVGSSIKTLHRIMEERKHRTYGELFYTILKEQLELRNNKKHFESSLYHVRGLYTSREDYLNEYRLIMKSQSQFHSDITQELIEKIEHLIFFQRPLKRQKELVGYCSIYHQEKRAHKLSYEAQKARIWGMLHNLSYKYKKEGKFVTQEISLDQKKKIFNHIEKEDLERLSQKDLINLLGLPYDIYFNLQEVKKVGLPVMPSYNILKKYAFFNNFSSQEKADFIDLCIEKSYNEKELEDFLIAHHIPSDKVSDIIDFFFINYDWGYVNNSRKALGEIIEKMEEGFNRFKAEEELGFVSGDSRTNRANKDKLDPPENLRNPTVNKGLSKLYKMVNKMIEKYGKPEKVVIEFSRDFATSAREKKEIQKKQTMNEKYNQLIEKKLKDAGYPINQNNMTKLKLFEELGGVSKAFCPYTLKNISYETLFSEEIQIEHIKPWSRSFDNRMFNKTLCYAEKNSEKGNRCPVEYYSKEELKSRVDRLMSCGGTWGDPTKGKLRVFLLAPRYTPEFEEKGASFYIRKKDQVKIGWEDLVSGADREITDTRYFAKASREYLSQLFEKLENVEVGKGSVTHIFREVLGLNALINAVKAPQKKKKGEEKEEKTPSKNRNDLRHHALDAMVTSFMTPKLQTMVVRAKKEAQKDLSEQNKTPDDLDYHESENRLIVSLIQKQESKNADLLNNIKDEITKNLPKVIVTYEKAQGITGALHEDTVYGKDKITGELHFKKDIKDPKFNIAKVKDDFIKKLLEKPEKKELTQKEEYNKTVNDYDERQQSFGLFTEQEKKEYIFEDKKGHKFYIKSLRLSKNKIKENSKSKKGNQQEEEQQQDFLIRKRTPYQYYTLGNNHHVAFFKNKKNNKVVGVVVSALDVSKRQPLGISKKTKQKMQEKGQWKPLFIKNINDYEEKYKKELIRKKNALEDLEFLYTLQKNDIIVHKKNQLILKVRNLKQSGRLELTPISYKEFDFNIVPIGTEILKYNKEKGEFFVGAALEKQDRINLQPVISGFSDYYKLTLDILGQVLKVEGKE